MLEKRGTVRVKSVIKQRYSSLQELHCSRSLDGLQDQIALQTPQLKKNAQETDFVKLKCKEYEKINRELEVQVKLRTIYFCNSQ